jgi:hypothetical protein
MATRTSGGRHAGGGKEVAMAWTFFAGNLMSGESARWSFWWDNNDYQGIQVIQARPIPVRSGDVTFIFPAELVVSDPGLKLELNGGYTYTITVTNRGPWSTDYEFVGDNV